MRVGFLGFGEAASSIAMGLHQAGVDEIIAYDVDTSGAPQQRAARIGPRVLVDLEELGATSDVIFCAVVAAVAVRAATSIAPYLRASTIYADINSSSPRTKHQVGDVVLPHTPLFADVAVMSPVPGRGHRVPMLVCGPGAAPLYSAMRPFGMQMELLEGEIGAAAATKMLRSVLVKGIEALLLESLLAASQVGVADQVLTSVEQSFGHLSFPQLANHLLTRNAIHGARRAHELEEAAETLTDLGVDPIVTEGAAERLRWTAGQHLPEHFNGQMPASYQAVIEALRHIVPEAS